MNQRWWACIFYECGLSRIAQSLSEFKSLIGAILSFLEGDSSVVVEVTVVKVIQGRAGKGDKGAINLIKNEGNTDTFCYFHKYVFLPNRCWIHPRRVTHPLDHCHKHQKLPPPIGQHPQWKICGTITENCHWNHISPLNIESNRSTTVTPFLVK